MLSPPCLPPLPVQPLGGNGDRGAEALGEAGDAVLFEHPAVEDQFRVEHAGLLVLLGSIRVGFPPGEDLVGLLSVAGQRAAAEGVEPQGDGAEVAGELLEPLPRRAGQEAGGDEPVELLADVGDRIGPLRPRQLFDCQPGLMMGLQERPDHLDYLLHRQPETLTAGVEPGVEFGGGGAGRWQVVALPMGRVRVRATSGRGRLGGLPRSACPTLRSTYHLPLAIGLG